MLGRTSDEPSREVRVPVTANVNAHTQGRAQRAPVALAAALLALATAGCAASGPAGPAPAAAVAPADQPLVDAVAALCVARKQATSTVPAARATFYDRSHDAMHALARRTESVDRPATARLLEAKNNVEQDFLYPRTWERLGDDLARLDDAARAALGVLRISTPAACGT
jgi:hypothetical protein